MKSYQNIIKSGNYINGKWVQDGNGFTLNVQHKFTQESIAKLPLATEVQMEEAIIAAQQGFEVIKKWPAGKKAAHLSRLKDLLEEEKEAFAQLIVAEAGKPIGYARNEIDRCLTTLETAITESTRFGGETVPLDYGAGAGKTAFTKRFPLGPIACISPFNFPLNLALHKIAPALAVGCSFVLKPAPQSPLSCLAFAALVEKAGYPAGVVNILVCDIPVAQKMVTDPRLKMLSFTGSPQVGWYLKSIAGEKKIALELGGNASVIVDDSADLDKAAKNTAIGAYLYAGQICISTQRIYVHEKVFNAFREKLLNEMDLLVSGNPFEEGVVNGPIIDSSHLQRISTWVEEAKTSGAAVLRGGKILNENACIYAPTLLTNTNKKMKVVQEEVFGPVAILEKVSSFQEALDQTNDSRFGLQAGVFTNRIDHMKMALEELEVGGVIINNVPGFRMDAMPYGGVKASGLGREGIKYAMEEMTEPRLIVY